MASRSKTHAMSDSSESESEDIFVDKPTKRKLIQSPSKSGDVEFKSPFKRKYVESKSPLKSQHSISTKPVLVKREGFGFSLTKVRGINERFNAAGLAYNLTDIITDHNHELLQSVQFNYVIDIPWILNQYPEKFRSKPILIVHGEQRESKKALQKASAKFPNVKLCQANLPIPYGTHHTKMMFLLYDDGLRVVIHTSNLVVQDWDQKSQGIWMSPVLPALKSDSFDGDSVTNFKKDLLQYVAAYQTPELREWLPVIKKHDFSLIKVFLISSVPGRHVSTQKTAFGHLKLRKVLAAHIPELDDFNSYPVVAQFSSIGSLGNSESQWLCSELLSSLSASKKRMASAFDYSKLNLVYPSVENVRRSLEGYPAGSSLPYSYKTEQKQPYLRRYFCQWSAESSGRTYASPHIKTYLRCSPDCAHIAWFLVTSANLSKAAWGSLEKKGEQLMIRSYELGVLFLPQFLCSTKVFQRNGTGLDVFPVPYDLPVKKYGPTDEPWIWDIPQIKAPDRNGNKWCPPLR